VVQVQPARHWKQNGQLRLLFRDLVLPNGIESKVEAMVQGVQSGRADNLQLDAEGGAEAKNSKTRYLRSGIAVGLAAATHEDEPLNRAEGGAGGFKIVGIVIGASVHSQPLAIAMGAFGASRFTTTSWHAEQRLFSRNILRWRLLSIRAVVRQGKLQILRTTVLTNSFGSLSLCLKSSAVKGMGSSAYWPFRKSI